MRTVLDPSLVKNSAKLLAVLSKTDNLTIFTHANEGFDANSSIPESFGLTKKTYYTRLKQLLDAGLVTKLDGSYIHTTLGTMIYQNHIIGIMKHIENIKELKMVDTLKQNKGFSDDDIANFVSKVTNGSTDLTTLKVQPKIEVRWTYEEMVAEIVQRIEFCKNEILLASKYNNELIIQHMLRKAQAGLNVKVIADKSLVKKFFEQNKGMELNDKNVAERIKVVGNPWYPGNVSRRIGDLPFSLIIFDGKEVGIELVDSKKPDKFSGVIFIRDEKTSNEMANCYQKIWDSSSEDNIMTTAKSAITKQQRVSERYIVQ